MEYDEHKPPTNTGPEAPSQPSYPAQELQAPASFMPTVLQRLGLAAGSLPSYLSIEEIIATLHNEQWNLRLAAVQALAKLEGPRVQATLLGALQDAHPSVRAAAIKALSNLSYPIPTERLLRAVHDPEWTVRVQALQVVGTQRDMRTIAAVTQSLNDEDELVREAARNTLELLSSASRTAHPLEQQGEQDNPAPPLFSLDRDKMTKTSENQQKNPLPMPLQSRSKTMQQPLVNPAPSRSASRKTRNHTENRLWASVAVLVAVLVVIGSSLWLIHNKTPQTGGQPSPTVLHHKPTPTPSPTPVTQPVPPTQTTCPAPGTARALVTAPLNLGQNPQLIYIAADNTGDGPHYHRIMRYDPVSKTSIEIANIPVTLTITSSKLSSDGKWLLLEETVPPAGQGITYQIQAIRVDGQGLQTLYCSDSIRSTTWSPDMHWIAFGDAVQYPGSPETIHVIDTTSGKLLSTVDVPQNQPGEDPWPFLWFSNTQVYLQDLPSDNPFNTYLLDITKGEHQKLSDLTLVSHSAYTAAAVDKDTLFLSEVERDAITKQPALGGGPVVVFQRPQLIIENFLYAAQSQTIVVFGHNSATNAREIWTVKSDGSNAKRIASAPAQTQKWLTTAVLSPDGAQFALDGWPTASGNGIQIVIGSIQDGTLTPVPINEVNSELAGWGLF